MLEKENMFFFEEASWPSRTKYILHGRNTAIVAKNSGSFI